MPLSAIAPTQYDTLLEEKVTRVTSLLSLYTDETPRVFPSSTTGYRLRAEFRMWHEGDDLNYVMFKRSAPKTPVPITDFPIADDSIRILMPDLLQRLCHSDTLRRKIFQVEFLATLSGEMLITLIYHRKLDETWEESARALLCSLQERFAHLSIIGRSRKQKIIIDRDFAWEQLDINGQPFRYRQYEQSFTQPNGRVNIEMIQWACQQAQKTEGDLLELYCGNGNFTLPLSRYYNNVIATELSKVSVRAARANIEENCIDNVQIVRLSAEEVTQAMNREREFRRLAELPKPLSEFDLQTVFVDPPRAGLDAQTTAMAAGFANIVYISCNPETLAENLAVLCKTHRVSSFALFDQFPYTHHMECGVLLQALTDST